MAMINVPPLPPAAVEVPPPQAARARTGRLTRTAVSRRRVDRTRLGITMLLFGTRELDRAAVQPPGWEGGGGGAGYARVSSSRPAWTQRTERPPSRSTAALSKEAQA